jgi:hypothetical protein
VAPRPDYGQLRPWARLRRFAHGWRRILSRTYIFAPWLDARADALRPGLLRTVFANRDAATRGGPRS